MLSRRYRFDCLLSLYGIAYLKQQKRVLDELPGACFLLQLLGTELESEPCLLLIADRPLSVVCLCILLGWVWCASRSHLGHLLHVLLIENEVAAVVESRMLSPDQAHPLHIGAQLDLGLRA